MGRRLIIRQPLRRRREDVSQPVVVWEACDVQRVWSMRMCMRHTYTHTVGVHMYVSTMRNAHVHACSQNRQVHVHVVWHVHMCTDFCMEVHTFGVSLDRAYVGPK